MTNANSDKLKDLFIARDGNQPCYIDDLRSIIASKFPGGFVSAILGSTGYFNTLP